MTPYDVGPLKAHVGVSCLGEPLVRLKLGDGPDCGDNGILLFVSEARKIAAALLKALLGRRHSRENFGVHALA